MKRFTKTKLIDDVYTYADRKNNAYHFNGNGLSQLWPRNATDKEKALIEKSFEYGQWRAAKNIASWVEEGDFGA